MAPETLPVAQYAGDLASLAGAGPGGITLVPECSTPTHLYAVEWVSLAKRHIWRRQLDGEAWEQTNAALTGVSKILALSNGDILINSGTAVRHSANGGVSTRLLTMTLTTGSTVSAWGSHRYRDNGTTVLLGEWSTGKKIWRASLADLHAGTGEFTAVNTAVFDSITHIHGIHWHAGTARWIAFCGDGAASLNAYSTDDGLTWTAFEAIGLTNGLHPMSSADVGHATELVTGQDGYGGILRYSCGGALAGQVRKVGFPDPRNGYAYLFDVWYENGLVYACTSVNVAGAGHRVTIYVSPDAGETWCAWLRFPSTIRFVAVRGIVGGKIQIAAYNGTNWIPYEASKPTIALREALLTLPAGINSLSDNAASVFAAGHGWTGGGASVAQYTPVAPNTAWHGTTCLKVTATGTLPTAYSPFVPVAAGYYVFGKVRVKALGHKGHLQVGLIFDPWSLVDTPFAGTEVVEGSWSEISIGPVLVAAGKTSVQVYVQPSSSGFWVSGDEYLVDGAELYMLQTSLLPLKCPSRWALPSAARAATEYTFTKTLGAAWTCLITWVPDIDSALLRAGATAYMPAGTKLCVASWKADANNWAILYFDPGDAGKFNLQVTDDNGATSEVISIAAATWWQKHACIRFAVRHDGSNLKLSVANGGTVEHVAATVDGEYGGLAGAAVAFRAGHTDGSAILPGLFRAIRFFDSSLSNDALAAVMVGSELAYPDYTGIRSDLTENLALSGFACNFGNGSLVVGAYTLDGANAIEVVSAGAYLHGGIVQNIAYTDVAKPLYRLGAGTGDSGNGAGVIRLPAPASGSCVPMAA